MKPIECDYLVIGCGLSGLTAALKLAPHGHVVVLAKKGPMDSNSAHAQGGIAIPISDGDSVEAHLQDTLQAGAGLTHKDVAGAIIASGMDRLHDLENWGVHFEQKNAKASKAKQAYDLGREGGHSFRRVLHAGDITGQNLIQTLLRRAKECPSIQILNDHMAIDLITSSWLRLPGDNVCLGVYALNTKAAHIFPIRAKATILATGGAGKTYLYTSNPDIATGDGIAMAWRSGLPIRNMEFVQFHPTCLYHPEAKSFLISEAVRGEGARLINGSHKPFMKQYDERGELASRDIVARAIDNEMKTRGDACVYLDITHRDSKFIKQRFPHIYATCKTFGFDMTKEPIPVVPAAHYLCGGVEADVHGQTRLTGLYAVGEVACTGLHGANRLASNSLLEALVCGHNAAQSILENPPPKHRKRIAIPRWKTGYAVPSDEAVVVTHNWDEVRTVMWDYVGIVRTNRRLTRALRRITTLRHEIRNYYRDYLVTADLLELRNIAAVGELIIRSAMQRLESRGLHYTLDYPFSSPGMQHDTIIHDLPGGNVN